MKSKNMATYTIKLDDNSNILLTNEKNETVSVLDLLKDHERSSRSYAKRWVRWM